MNSLLVITETDAFEPRAPRFLRMAGVRQMTGLGRSTIYRLVAEHQFPSPGQLSRRAVGWRLSDLEQWSRARQTSSIEIARSRTTAALPAAWP